MSTDDANVLAGHLTSNQVFWWNIRWALAKAGAKPPVLGASLPSL
jgi:hypothetical protein